MPNTRTKGPAAKTGNSNGANGAKNTNSNGGNSARNSNSNGGRNGSSSEVDAPSMQNTQLEKLFLDLLKDIYWAEKHLTKALPKMQKASTTEELQSAFEDHTAQTEEHVTRLERVFEILGKKAQAKKCDAMEGLIKEGESAIEETEEGSATRDVALIVAAQKTEHYEIAGYGGLVTLAKTMGQDEVAEILGQTLEEEKQTDELLTQIAENDVNWQAGQEDEEGEDDKEEEE